MTIRIPAPSNYEKIVGYDRKDLEKVLYYKALNSYEAEAVMNTNVSRLEPPYGAVWQDVNS